MHLSQRGFTVRLVTATGEDPSSAWHLRDAGLNTGPLLEALAVVQPVQQPPLDTSWLTEAGHGGLTIGGLRERRGHRRPRRYAGCSCTRARRWPSPSTSTRGSPPGTRRGGSATLLTQQGWRATPLGPRDRLDNVWQDLGRSSAPLPRSSGAVVPAPGRVAR